MEVRCTGESKSWDFSLSKIPSIQVTSSCDTPETFAEMRVIGIGPFGHIRFDSGWRHLGDGNWSYKVDFAGDAEIHFRPAAFSALSTTGKLIQNCELKIIGGPWSFTGWTKSSLIPIGVGNEQLSFHRSAVHLTAQPSDYDQWAIADRQVLFDPDMTQRWALKH